MCSMIHKTSGKQQQGTLKFTGNDARVIWQKQIIKNRNKET